MRRLKWSLCLLSALAATAAMAQPFPIQPRLFSFQAQLTAPGGTPVPDATRSVTFRLYNFMGSGHGIVGETHTFADNSITLKVTPVAEGSETVQNSDGTITYTQGTAYTINYETGVITRVGGAIGATATVRVNYMALPRLLWEETQQIETRNGLIQTLLFNNLLPGATRLDGPLHLEVQVEGEVLSPRIPIGASPRAMALTHLRIEDTVPNSPNLVGGNPANSVAPGVDGATISGGGGRGDTTEERFPNTVTGRGGTIGGGSGNTASNFATVAGGYRNQAIGIAAAVGGGTGNSASGLSTIGGGYFNTATSNGTVGGGQANRATGAFSTVPGGHSNEATGNSSFAAGSGAKATHHGTFVWADSLAADVTSLRENNFRARATGGFFFEINGSHSVSFYQQSSLGFPSRVINTSTGAYLATGGTWTNSSDAALKENFQPVQPQEVLRSVVALPVSTWNYKAEGVETRHIGPTAQDFLQAFSLGGDNRAISTVDASGVALAAIQGLYELLKEEQVKNAALEARFAASEAARNDLEIRLGVLEQRR